jgi:uncharacterized protein
MTQQDDFLARILTETRTIALVGFSDKPARPSHGVARDLQHAGYRVLPVNPLLAGQRLLGEQVFASLRDIPGEIGAVDMVDIFRRSDRAGAVVDEALDVLRDRGLKTIWMQLGVIDRDAAARAEDADIQVVMDRCPKIDHARLIR